MLLIDRDRRSKIRRMQLDCFCTGNGENRKWRAWDTDCRKESIKRPAAPNLHAHGAPVSKSHLEIGRVFSRRAQVLPYV